MFSRALASDSHLPPLLPLEFRGISIYCFSKLLKQILIRNFGFNTSNSSARWTLGLVISSSTQMPEDSHKKQLPKDILLYFMTALRFSTSIMRFQKISKSNSWLSSPPAVFSRKKGVQAMPQLPQLCTETQLKHSSGMVEHFQDYIPNLSNRCVHLRYPSLVKMFLVSGLLHTRTSFRI